MTTRRNRKRHDPSPLAPSPVGPPEEVLRWLTPSLLGVLASLHGAPRDLAEASIQLLPFGSRAALEDRGLAVPVGDEADGFRALRLTDFAFDVMAAAAAAAESSPASVDELEDRADAAIARLCAGGSD
jgi:hypothetical protein